MNDAALNTLSDAVLTAIRRRPIRSHSPKQLAQTLKCREADIVFALDLLRRTGYEIDSDRAGRVTFITAPDLLLAAEIAHGLKTSFVGRNVYAYKSVQSTNSIAAQLAEANAPDGAIVVAETQTKGRGRLARPWFSPERSGIYLSIILHPDIEPAVAPGISIMTALSLADTMAEFGSMEVRVKWPNDCLLNGRKAAGILTELSADMDRVHHLIVGVGININHRRRDFPPEITRKATSLRAETKTPVRRVEFLQKFLIRFERDYRRFVKSGLKPFRKRILACSSLLGKKIKLDMHGMVISGTAVDVDDHGNIVLETAEGRCTFSAGDVTVLRNR